MRGGLIRSVVPLLVLSACSSPSRESSTSSTPTASVMTPDGPPPVLPSNAEMAAMKPPPSKKKEPEIPEEPPEDPPTPDVGPKKPAHAKVNALLAAIEGADAIEIKDSWSGMRGSYSMFVRLDRKGDDVTWRATVGNALKRGTTTFATIKPFLHRLARKRVDPKQDYQTGNEHTDDYPKIHITVTGKALAATLHLEIADNQRHWMANGLFIAPDPSPPPYEVDAFVIEPGGASRREKQTITPTDKHAHVNQSYERMMALLGARAWIAESLQNGDDRGL